MAKRNSKRAAVAELDPADLEFECPNCNSVGFTEVEGGCNFCITKVGEQDAPFQDSTFEVLPRLTYNSIELEQVDPGAVLIVMVDIQRMTSEFRSGTRLHREWWSNDLHHIGATSTLTPPRNYFRILCPDGTYLFARFLTVHVQLLDSKSPKPQLGIKPR